MGLLRVAAVAGTASAVSGRVQRNQQQKYAAQDAAAAQAAAPAAPAASDEDPMAQVQKLAELHKQGILTDEEFAAAKAKVLGI
ncbi:MAG: SHOCT domain-containing protein [Actinomycetes bacterium]